MDFALSGTYERSSGVGRLYLPAFDTPHENSGLAENLDGERSGQVYGRFSMNGLIVTGVFGRRVKDVPTASFFTVFNAHDPIQDTTEARAQVSAQYARTLGAARLTTGASIDHAKGVGVYPYPNEEPLGPSLSFADNVRGLRWTLNTRVIRPLRGRQTLTLGGEFVDNIRQDQWGGFPFSSDYNFRVERSSRQGGLFVQDEIKLRPWLLVNAGLRHDRFPGFNRTTPRGAVIVMPSANHSLKYLYGRAFRAPNASELYRYRDAIAYLRAESIDTHEWGWEAYFGERVRTSVSTYRYKASQLVERGVDPDALLNPIFFANTGTVRAAGLELESEIRLKRGAQALTSYTLQDATDDSNGQRLTNSPRHMAKLRISVPGPWDRSFASFEWQYLSSRTTLVGTTVDPASVAHVNVNVPIGRSVALTGHIHNLFNARYADPASAEQRGDSIEQNGRTLRVGFRWSFWDTK